MSALPGDSLPAPANSGRPKAAAIASGWKRTTVRNRFELAVPPVALVVIAAALMWTASLAVPVFDFALPGGPTFWVGLTLMGALTCLAGVASFRAKNTTVNPMKPRSTSSLVVSGIYRHSRNPMYLGFLLILLGWAAFLSNVSAFLVLPAFVSYMNRFQISPEERALDSLFGRAYAEYRTAVRRWL